MQGQMPPLVGHHRWPGESSSCGDARLGFLHCRDTGLYLLMGIEPHLLRMR
jgi:hypothetical protein